MSLSGIFVAPELRERFTLPVRITYLGPADMDEIICTAGQSVFEIGCHSWMRYVDSGAETNPRALAVYFDSDDPRLFQAIEQLIGEPVIRDIQYVHAEVEDEGLQYKTAARLLVANKYPGELHIADVEFSDVYRPIPEGDRTYRYQTHSGLGLFGPQLAKLERYVKSEGLRGITLTAASQDQVTYFERYGFVVDDNDAARHASAAGIGPPMSKLVE